jgi:hypothetical protein
LRVVGGKDGSHSADADHFEESVAAQAPLPEQPVQLRVSPYGVGHMQPPDAKLKCGRSAKMWDD